MGQVRQVVSGAAVGAAQPSATQRCAGHSHLRGGSECSDSERVYGAVIGPRIKNMLPPLRLAHECSDRE
eukprot:2861381-Pyramimonas_sp.AAC.1